MLEILAKVVHHQIKLNTEYELGINEDIDEGAGKDTARTAAECLNDSDDVESEMMSGSD